MDNKTNEILQKNVALLSKLTEQEVNMMPAIGSRCLPWYR